MPSKSDHVVRQPSWASFYNRKCFAGRGCLWCCRRALAASPPGAPIRFGANAGESGYARFQLNVGCAIVFMHGTPRPGELQYAPDRRIARYPQYRQSAWGPTHQSAHRRCAEPPQPTRRPTMNWRQIVAITTVLLGLALLPGSASSQQKPLKTAELSKASLIAGHDLLLWFTLTQISDPTSRDEKTTLQLLLTAAGLKESLLILGLSNEFPPNPMPPADQFRSKFLEYDASIRAKTVQLGSTTKAYYEFGMSTIMLTLASLAVTRAPANDDQRTDFLKIMDEHIDWARQIDVRSSDIATLRKWRRGLATSFSRESISEAAQAYESVFRKVRSSFD